VTGYAVTMVKKIKSKVDVGKGFKRIYFVLASLWVGFITIIFLANFSFCVVHADKNRDTLECLGYSIIQNLIQYILIAGLVFPLYYFLRWIVEGFKK
jgi:hypothetical protein